VFIPVAVLGLTFLSLSAWAETGETSEVEKPRGLTIKDLLASLQD
jgi:hypothetical protein